MNTSCFSSHSRITQVLEQLSFHRLENTKFRHRIRNSPLLNFVPSWMNAVRFIKHYYAVRSIALRYSAMQTFHITQMHRSDPLRRRGCHCPIYLHEMHEGKIKSILKTIRDRDNVVSIRGIVRRRDEQGGLPGQRSLRGSKMGSQVYTLSQKNEFQGSKVFKHFRKISKSNYQLPNVCLSLCPSVRMEQLGSHWTDFHEILYLDILGKTVEKIQVSLKPDKNTGYFT